MSTLWKDIRYASRMMVKNPGFTLTAVLALALGIGANTAIFSLVSGILWGSLSYKDPDRVVVIWERNSALGMKRIGPSGPNYLDWKEQSTSFEHMALVEPGSGTVIGLGEPQQVPGMRVTSDLLPLAGASMVLGRWFHANEGHGSGDKVVVLAHDYWKSQWGADPGILGRKYTADGLVYTVIGVASPDFRSPVPADLFVPWNADDLRRMDRMRHDYGVLARLKPGVTIEQAQAELATIQRSIGEKYPAVRGFDVTVMPLADVMVEGIRKPLLILLCAVGFVLLIACANVANLLLARMITRQREIALRAALGAGRVRLVRQFLVESVLVAVAGGAAGLTLSLWGIELLKAMLPGTLPIPGSSAEALLQNVGINGTVLVFTLLVSLLTGLVFGLLPALSASSGNAAGKLREAGRSHSPGLSHRRLRDSLVVAEVALALVLLAGAGLMISTFRNLARAYLGFQPSSVLTMQMEVPTDTKYREGPERSVFYQKVMLELEAVPGVRSAGLTQILPLDARVKQEQFVIEGDPPLPGGVPSLITDYAQVSPHYFRTMGIALRHGRFFEDNDNRDAPPVAVISEALAERHFSGRNPLGRRLEIHGRRWEIVGVAGDVKHAGLERSPQPTVYLPCYQAAGNLMSVVVRTDGPPERFVQAVKEAVWRVDKDQPLYRIRTMDQVVSGASVAVRMTAVVLGIFAALAVLMAAIGIYGVMSYSVSQRRQEMGVRMAVGARAADVLQLVVRQGVSLAAAGVALGLLAALALTRLLGTLLFGVSATDPLVLASVAAMLVAVSAAASYLPARRATRMDATVALHYE